MEANRKTGRRSSVTERAKGDIGKVGTTAYGGEPKALAALIFVKSFIFKSEGIVE